MNCSRLCALLLIVLIIASKLFRKKKSIFATVDCDETPLPMFYIQSMKWNGTHYYSFPLDSTKLVKNWTTLRLTICF